MKSIWHSTLEEIRETTAGSKPVATSGAISVIGSVYGCSLLRMTLHLSIPKTKTRAAIDKIKELLVLVEKASDELSVLADKDIEVFQSFLSKFALPEGTPEQRKLRREELVVMRLEAIRIPLTAAELITKLYSAIFEAIPICSKNVLPDLAVSANMFYSSVTSLLWSAKTNAKQLKEEPRMHLENAARLLKNDAKLATKQVNKLVSKSLGIS